MIPVFRGMKMATRPVTDFSKLGSVALLIADKQAGPFEMRLLKLEAVKMADESEADADADAGGDSDERVVEPRASSISATTGTGGQVGSQKASTLEAGGRE